MAITIDRPNYDIQVPRTDMTLIQSSPVEVRQLDTDAFRRALRDLDDDEEGRAWPITHDHNTEVTISGLNYARQVLIREPYTITFEDGQYVVQLTGSNNNILDKTNKNQVSVASNNSAGLISSSDIEYSSFNRVVLVDQVSGVLGTLFPAGTVRAPVQLTSDAKVIANFRGISAIEFIGNGLLTTGDDFTGFLIRGKNAALSTITVDPAAVVTQCEFQDCTLTGTLDGGSIVRNAIIDGINYLNGVAFNCLLTSSPIVLGGGTLSNFLNCYTTDQDTTIDCGGSGQSLSMQSFSGDVILENKTGSDVVHIQLNSGTVQLKSTVTGGTIEVHGDGELIDFATGLDIPTGTWNGVTILNKTSKMEVWNVQTADIQVAGTTGKALTDAGGAGNPWSVPLSGNDSDGTFGGFIQKKLLTFVKFITSKDK